MTDDDLKRLLDSALDVELGLHRQGVAVTVSDGFATIRGSVGSHLTRSIVEEVALRLDGLKAVVNDLRVQ